MKIALIQQHATKNNEDNIKRGVQAFKKAAQNGAKLIAFAELAFTYFYPQYVAKGDILSLAETIPGPTTDQFTALSKEYQIVTILNLFEKDGEKAYDSSPVIDSDGSIPGVNFRKCFR